MFYKKLLPCCPAGALLGACLTTALVVLPLWSQEPLGKKFAFLVGCSKYVQAEFSELPFTANDVRGFREALLQTGYPADQVVVMHDATQEPKRFLPDRGKILKEFDLLLERVREQDTVVVAFSGHGLQFADEKVNYFVPVDGKVEDKSTLIALRGEDGLYERLGKSKARLKLLIVNADRNDPTAGIEFPTRNVLFRRQEREQSADGSAAIFSCLAGQKSHFDRDLKQSLFFNHVIRAWKGEYDDGGEVTLESFFDQVTERTKTDANRLLDVNQTPSVQRQYKGDWLIASAAAKALKDRARISEKDAPKVAEKEAVKLPEKDAPKVAEKEAAKLSEKVVPKVAEKEVAKLPKKETATIANEIANSIGMKLRLIPAGTFMMGSAEGDKDRWYGEKEHQVEITQPFYLGVFEVTQGEYQKVMGTNPSQFCAKEGGSIKVAGLDTTSFPVESVSWHDAMAFCKKLTASKEEKDQGRVYDLPTEAEWEYACRGGSKVYQKFHLGDSLTAAEANIDLKLGRTAKVGSYLPNGFGLFDMHGNVWEWCKDWYDIKYYDKSPRKDPLGPEDGKIRVVRGGSCANTPDLCRSAFRYGEDAGFRLAAIGFRVVLRKGAAQ